jgi:hypothetical protein
MRQRDWFLRVTVTLLVVGVWVLILRPVLAPQASQAASGEKVVRAQRFEMVDEEGKVRAVLGFVLVERDPEMWPFVGRVPSPSLEPGLALIDKEQKTRARLSLLEEDGAGLSLADKAGQLRARLDLWPKSGEPRLRMFNEGGGKGVDLALTSNGKAGIYLRGQRREAAELGLTPVGTPRLSMQGRDGKGSAELEMTPDGDASLALRDSSGRLRFSAP